MTEVGDPAVGIHVDGIYAPRPQAAALMFDLERAELLEGLKELYTVETQLLEP